MKYSRTALKELTREYKNVLKKCFLLNLGLVLCAGVAQATDLNVDVGETRTFTEGIYDYGKVTVDGNLIVKATNDYALLRAEDGITLNPESSLTVEVVPGTEDTEAEVFTLGELKANNSTIDLKYNDEVTDEGSEPWLIASDMTLTNTKVSLSGGALEGKNNVTLNGVSLTGSMSDLYSNHLDERPCLTEAEVLEEILSPEYAAEEFYSPADFEYVYGITPDEWNALSDEGKIAKHDEVSQVLRTQVGGTFEIVNSNISMQNASEIMRSNSGDIVIKGSNIELKEGNFPTTPNYSSMLSHEGTSGNIVIASNQEDEDNPRSVVTLTGNSGIVRGLYDWSAEDNTKRFDVYQSLGNTDIYSEGSIILDNSTLNLNDTSFVAFSDFEPETAVMNVQNGAEINVNGDNTIWADAVDVTDSTVTVGKGKTLTVYDTNKHPDEQRGGSGGINLNTADAILNLSGTLNADVGAHGEKAGTLAINDSSAIVNGDIEGVNLTINENFNSANFKGMATGLGDVTLANGKTFTLNITEDLTDGEENLIVDSFSMGEGSTLNLTSNMEFEDGDPDLKVTKGISITGGILNLNGAGLKVEDDSVGSFKMEDAIVSQNTAGIVDRFVDTDMIISNSTITMANESYTEKDGIGDMIIRDSTITLNNEAELGKYQEGTLYIDNSNVNMTGDAFIYVDRGFLNIENESTVQMNGTASIEFDEDNLSDQNIINVTNDATVVANGQNQILADAVDVTNNGTVRIAKGANLTVYDANKHPDEDRGGRGGLNLNTADAVLDLSGTISADVGTNGEEAGTIVINDSSAAVQGDIDAVNLTVNKDWTLTSSDEYEVKSLGDVTANAKLTLNLPVKKELEVSLDTYESYHGKLDIGNIFVADGKKLDISSNYKGEYYDEQKEKLIDDFAEIEVDSLTLSENSQLNLKDVVLHSENIDKFLEANKVEINLDNSGLSFETGMTFTDSEITLANGSEISSFGFNGQKMDENKGIVTLNNTTVNTTDSGLDPNHLRLENKSNLNLQHGWLDLWKELSIDDSTVTASDNTEVWVETVNVKNGAEFNLSDSTLLFSDGISITNATLNITDGLLTHSDYGTMEHDEQGNWITRLVGEALILDGGVVNVSGKTTFLASEVSVGNQLNVLEGATLTTATTGAQKPIEDDESYDYEAGFEKANITVAETGQITNDGTIDNDITNGGVIVNNSVINGDLTNNGVYTGLISGVSGEFDNTNGTVNTWGDLDTDINGITNLTDVSALTKNVTMGTVNVRKSLDLDNNVLTANSVHVADNSLVSFRVSDKGTYGHIEADTISVSTIGTTLKLTVDAGILDKGDWMEAKVLSTTALTGSFATLSSNALYKFEDLGSGLFKITNTESAPDVIIDAGGTEDDKKVAEAWLDGDDFEEGTPAANVAEHLNDLAQNNPEAFKDAVEALKPDPAPTGHATANAVNNQIAGAVGGRLGGGQAPRGRALAVAQRGPGMQPNNRPSNSRPAGNSVGRGRGRAGGDVYNNYVNAGLWAQGLYNKSKLDATSGFDGKTYGLSMGLDGEIFKGMKLGLGYAYTTSDIDATGRTTDVNTHTAILYGEKTFGNAFVNAVATYGFSKYEENKNVSGLKVKAKYDMDSIFGQGMAGYNMLFKNGTITPEAGIRYLWTKAHAYTDTAGQQVKASKTDTLTGVVGARAGMNTKIIGFDEIVFHPEISLRATYDIVDADNKSVVQLANGSSYTTNGKSLDRFGVEAGAGIGMRYDNIECSLNYEGKFKKDYSDHTGMVNLRYNF